MRRNLGIIITVGVAGLVTAGVLGWGMGVGAAPIASAAAAAPTAVPQYTLSIDTPDMLNNNPTGPALVPSNVQWPANTTIEVTIVNFDDATALNAGARHYATASGIIGAMSVRPLNPGNPNAATQGRHVTALNPETGVSHTFTIAALGVNVPVAPQSVTTFRFHTGHAGTYEWRCMDPCGDGTSGWGGAMAATGYMQGTVTFA